MKKIFLLLVLIFAVGVGVAFAQTFHFSEPSFGTIPPVPETYPPLTPGVVPPTSIHVPPPPPKPTLTCTDLTLPQQNPPLVISRNFPYNNDSWTGGEVTKLQKFLVQAGLLATTDFGFFGPLTEKAVQKFQDQYSVVSNTSSAYGYVGPATAAKIKEVSCRTTPPPPCDFPNIWKDSVCIPPLVKFVSGDNVETTDYVRIRATPSLIGAQISTVNPRTKGTISKGPVSADGYIWYEWTVDCTSSIPNAICAPIQGWSAENYLQKITPTTPSITVLSPNGGEQWEKGKTHTVSWKLSLGI